MWTNLVLLFSVKQQPPFKAMPMQVVVQVCLAFTGAENANIPHVAATVIKRIKRKICRGVGISRYSIQF